MYQSRTVAVLAPCYNEESKIGTVVDRIQATGIADEIVVIDDGSTDRSAPVCKERGATVLSLGRTLGVGAALRHGFEYARHRAGILVVIAGNNKDEPEEIPRLLEPIVTNKAVFVQGSRFLPGGAYGGEMPLYRKIATRLHPLLFSALVGKRVTESTNGFRAIEASVLKDERINLNQSWLDGYSLEPYLYYKVITLGYSTMEAPVTKIYPPKKLGYTKMIPVLSWWDILRPLVLLRLGIRK